VEEEQTTVRFGVGLRTAGTKEAAMDHRIAWPRPWGRVLSATAAFAALVAAATLLAPPPAVAQTKKPAAKPAAPAAAAPPAAQNGQPQLMYSPWMKVCGKGQDTNNKKVCVVTKDGRLENGMPVAIVQLFEPEGQPKMLRVTVPLGMQLQHGTRLIIDQDAPVNEPYKICFPVGCMSDYPVSDDMIKKMKKGQTLTVQAINMRGQPISLPLPLSDFAKAFDGPPTDPKVFETQQRKLQEELQKKAEAARKRLEAQKPAAPMTPAPKQ
jgi:invasion protein IalB